jgi:tripartite-type tricarboxylate transporter receptor subunit TctC
MLQRIFAGLLAAALAGAFGYGAQAADYPTKPVTLIVPFGAGGGTDVTARIVAEELGKLLGQSVIVDTRPGANGAFGSGVVAKSAPDGYTRLFTAQSTYSMNPNLMKQLPYDQLNDFVPVATIGSSPWLLTVPANSDLKNVADVVKYAKANPGKMTFGFWQSSVLITSETFARAAGLDLRKVPYKGAVEAQTDLIAERLTILFTDTLGAKPHVAAGKMRVLASTTPKRTANFPDVPTMAELGYPAVDIASMLAVFAPAKTPKPVLERLNHDINTVLKLDSVREKLKGLGQDTAIMSLAEADAFVRKELPRWADMIEKSGLQKQ